MSALGLTPEILGFAESEGVGIGQGVGIGNPCDEALCIDAIFSDDAMRSAVKERSSTHQPILLRW